MLDMSKNLVIVESPAKAKTIKKYLGSDYQVESSFGHIRDLPSKKLSIDVENDFEPSYEIPASKKKVVNALKKAAKDKTIWLASDEDREGEAIAWHLCKALGVDSGSTNRIVFHEITKPAIQAAIQSPRTVNQQLVDAQQARRVLDRLVGYKLSPVLWKKIRPGLSAGRVQSVAVRLIVEREREINAFSPKKSFKVTAELATNGGETISAELNEQLDDKDTARALLENIRGKDARVVDINKRPSKKRPLGPFITSTLQQEASRRLGFSVKQTMALAQQLYENGHITYMRTDSFRLSDTAIKQAASYIKKTYGSDYHQTRNFKASARGAQEAHEAIRPTNLTKETAGSSEAQQKLYRLIWQRTIASQMSDAKTNKTTLKLHADGMSESQAFVAEGHELAFDGFMKVYGGRQDDVILPDIKEGDTLSLQTVQAAEHFSSSPARYTEASLVKKLEDLGIGRPSTYAPTISTVQDRGYIEKANLEGEERTYAQLTLSADSPDIVESTFTKTIGADKSKLLPTSVALVTTDFLVKHFPNIVDYNFTAETEETLDKIADGDTKWNTMLKDFYTELVPLIEKSEEVSRQESMQAKELGTDPKTNKPILARFGRYGLMLQRGVASDDEKPEFAPMPEGETIDTITFEKALEMFKLPRLVGQTEDGKDIHANIGRFGPYIKVDSLYISIKPLDPFQIDLDEARRRYAEKLETEKNKNIKEFSKGLKVLNGPYGPYITDGKKNARIPKSIEPKDITEAEAKELISKARPARKRYKKR